MALYPPPPSTKEVAVGKVYSLDASGSSGHAVPGTPGTFFKVFKYLGDPQSICLVPPIGISAVPVVYTVKPNFPTFTPLTRRPENAIDLAVIDSEELLPEISVRPEEEYVRKNKPTFARFRR